MPLSEELQSGFRIGDWEVYPARRVLRCGDREITPEPKVWAVLVALAERGGDVVTRDELIDEVWGGRPTGDEPINRCISQLRKHLGDSRPYRYIKPVTGSGYLLQVPVEPLSEAESADDDPDRPVSWRLWPAVLGVAIIAVTAVLFVNRETPAPHTGPIRSIVVLPFENTSRDPADLYLTSGFRDEFASILKRIRGIRVKTGREAYPDASPEQIGRIFNVDSVLRGNVHRSGDELKVYYEVTRSSNGEVVANRSIKDQVRNVFEVQERLAQLVREDLFGISGRELVALSRPSNFDAYDSYLKGIYAFERRGNGRNLEQAIGMFETTIEHDPQFGPAYLQLATATALLPAYRGADVRESNRRAIEIVEQGIAADASIEAAAGAVFGFVYHSRKEWAKAELAYLQAINGEVVDANAFNWYSRMLASVGRLDAALVQALEAWQMDQDNPLVNSRVALSYFWVGDADNARRFFERAGRLGAKGTTHLMGYALFLASEGEINLASEIARRAAAQAGYSERWIDAVLAGMQDEARVAGALAEVDESLADDRLSPQIEVVVRTLLGDLDGAMRVARQLERPGEAFEMDLLWIPQFEPLRRRADFAALMDDLGIAEYWSLKGCRFENARVSCPTGGMRRAHGVNESRRAGAWNNFAAPVDPVKRSDCALDQRASRWLQTAFGAMLAADS